MEKLQDTIPYIITDSVSFEECTMIEQRIKEENQEHGYHMIEKTAQEFLNESLNGNCLAVKIDNTIVSYIAITHLFHNNIKLIERGSLFIKKEYRKHGLGYLLIKNMLGKHSKDQAMYCVSNVEAVKKINKKLGQYEYTKEMISKQILDIIEIPGKLLDDDVIFGNEIFNILSKQYTQ